MVEGFNPIRYSVIEDKNPREIVMLVGDGCKWRKCRFCDYHLDSSKDIEANFQLNKQILSNVTGKFGELEVINSGILVKGIEEKNPEVIANYFDEINLLQGISGQTKESMISDIETGLKYFSRICVNIMVENQMPIKPDKKVIEQFVEYVYPLYKDNDRVDILLNNTDFGVG